MEHRRQIPETDWKLWRELQKRALERFCQKALDDFAKFKDAEGTAHERYLKLYQLVKQRDKKLGQIFDGPSRSNAVIQLSAAVKARLITGEELDRFTEETRNRVALLTGNGLLPILSARRRAIARFTCAAGAIAHGARKKDLGIR